MTAAEQRAEDKERLQDVTHVLHGEHGTGAVQRVLYAVYLLGLLAFTYGFTVARALFITSDPAWLHDRLLGPGAAVVAVAARRRAHRARARPRPPPRAGRAAAAVGRPRRRRPPRPGRHPARVVARLGHPARRRRDRLRRGARRRPVGVGHDRAGVPRRRAARRAGAGGGRRRRLARRPGRRRRAREPTRCRAPTAPVAARGLRALGPSAALRRLGLPALRAQSIRSTRLGGAVLAGDLRAARLEAATPVHRGRGLRLRSHGRLLTVVARDLLGLRRQPGLMLSGALLAAPGAAGVAWSLSDPEVPVALAVVSVAALYLGVGVWAEGLRLLGDTLGTPRLSGLGLGTEAGAHTVLPASLFVLVALPLCLAVRALVPGTPSGRRACCSGWSGSGRSCSRPSGWPPSGARPPFLAFLPDVGPMVMTLWFARSLAARARSSGAADRPRRRTSGSLGPSASGSRSRWPVLAVGSAHPAVRRGRAPGLTRPTARHRPDRGPEFGRTGVARLTLVTCASTSGPTSSARSATSAGGTSSSPSSSSSTATRWGSSGTASSSTAPRRPSTTPRRSSGSPRSTASPASRWSPSTSGWRPTPPPSGSTSSGRRCAAATPTTPTG